MVMYPMYCVLLVCRDYGKVVGRHVATFYGVNRVLCRGCVEYIVEEKSRRKLFGSTVQYIEYALHSQRQPVFDHINSNSTSSSLPVVHCPLLMPSLLVFLADHVGMLNKRGPYPGNTNSSGVRLVASAHGDLQSLLSNPTLNTLVGGKESVVLSDATAFATNGGKKVRAVATLQLMYSSVRGDSYDQGLVVLCVLVASLVEPCISEKGTPRGTLRTVLARSGRKCKWANAIVQ